MQLEERLAAERQNEEKKEKVKIQENKGETTMDGKKKLLIVVDMQKDFVDGALGSAQAEKIVPCVLAKIQAYEEAGDEVVFTLDTHGEDYLDTLEGKHLPVKHCIKGTEGWKLTEALQQAAEGRKVFEKTTFGSTECAAYAAAGNYAGIELVGLCTDICVISNAMLCKAYAANTPVLVDAACCAGVTLESHERALLAMKSCQVEVYGE